MDFDGDEAILRKEGDTLVVTPVRQGRLLELIDSWEPIDDPFPDIDDDLGPLDDIRL